MSINNYPADAKVVLEWGEIFRKREIPQLSERASSKMVKIAAHLPQGEFVGWQMNVPPKGLTRFFSFGTAAVSASDLHWIYEKTAKEKAESLPKDSEGADSFVNRENWNLYEIQFSTEKPERKMQIGFSAVGAQEASDAITASDREPVWPKYFPREFDELMKALRSEGAVMRYVVGCATGDEQSICRNTVLSANCFSVADATEYIGTPVRVKTLLLIPSMPSVRLKTVIHGYAGGAELSYIGNMQNPECRQIWDDPMSSPKVLPDYAARIIAMEPIIGKTPIIGVAACDEQAKLIPAGHADTNKNKSILIGTALGTSGLERDIRLSDEDAKMHWQITGKTGMGKSTLLADVILNAIKENNGLTFFDPHGTTIDTVLEAIPEEHAALVRVARFGDAENPIPVNIWNTDDHRKAEKTISDLNMLFMEIFDPKQNGFIGPRWERWFSLFASASIVLLGKRASFESIIKLSQSRSAMEKLVDAIRRKAPALAESIQTEFADNKSGDFADLVSWCVSKMQRLTSIPQLRNTLGAGADALRFEDAIDNNTVTLIDLASPCLGTHASRVLGTLLMMKLQNAAFSRKNRENTHFVFIDEAHLFQTNPLPQMLAEGRKFGLSMILAHQHCGQLGREVRDSLMSNSANFSAFCLSRRDALEASDRLGDPTLITDLCRQNVFTAITTLCIDGVQTPAFTLQVRKPLVSLDSKHISENIYRDSINTLVKPYRNVRALSQSEIGKILDSAAKNPLPRHNEKHAFIDELRTITKEEV